MNETKMVKLWVGNDGDGSPIVAVDADREAYIRDRASELMENTEVFEAWMNEEVCATRLFYCDSYEDYLVERDEIQMEWEKHCEECASMEWDDEWEATYVNLNGGNI